MKKLCVMLTGGGAPGWLSIYRCLKAGSKNLDILACDFSPETLGSHIVKKSFAVPMGNEPRYVDALLSHCIREKVDIVLPITDAELLPLARNVDIFKQKGIKIPISSYQSLQIALNKLSLFQFLEKHNLENPTYVLVNSWKEFMQAIKKLGYPKKPVCFKPTISWGSRGFRIIDATVNVYDIFIHHKPTSIYQSLEQIELIFKKVKHFPQLLVMEYLPGDEYTVDVFMSFGKALYTIPRKRIQVAAGITVEGMVENNRKVIALSKKIIQELGLDYSVGVQMKLNASGEPKVLEINPRLQGTSVLSFAAGVNLPYLTILQCLKQKLPKLKIRYGIHMYRHWEEIFFKNKKVFPVYGKN